MLASSEAGEAVHPDDDDDDELDDIYRENLIILRPPRPSEPARSTEELQAAAEAFLNRNTTAAEGKVRHVHTLSGTKVVSLFLVCYNTPKASNYPPTE